MSYVQNSTNNPYGRKPWNFSTSRSGLAGCGVGCSSCSKCNGGMNYYSAANFPVPTSSRRNGLGDFQTDLSSLPPAPAGYQYVVPPGSVIPQLQAIPQQPISPIDTIGGVAILLAGAWWTWSSWKSSLSSASKLPVVQMNPASAFKSLENKLMGSARKRHYPLRSPGGLAATIGRKKYGAARFERMAERGRQ